MNTLTNAFNSITETILDKFDELTHGSEPTLSKAEVIELEEAERSRRMDQAASSRIAELNAAKTSSLIKSAPFPIFRGNLQAGYKRFTSRTEEAERQRRLAARAESTLRRANAQKSAGFIKSLGWPFAASTLNKGRATYVYPDVTEEERTSRINDPWAQMQAKNNAALVSGIIRMEHRRHASRFGTKRWTRNLEEKERARRLSEREELANSARNAYNLSKLIRNLGWPFFVQESEKAVDPTIALEEKERERRLGDREEQQMARENAGRMFSTLELQDIGSVEEREKARRLADFGEQKQAKSLARLVSNLVQQDLASKKTSSSSSAPLPLSSVRAYSLKKDDSLGGLSLRSIKFLEEQERKRRVNDIQGQAIAKQNAKKLSALVGSDFGGKNIGSLEEEERTRRMWDRPLQMQALSNARKVSKLVLAERRPSIDTRKANTASLEEKERDRRMVDKSYQQLARSHNKKISSALLDAQEGPREVSIPIEPLAQSKSFDLPSQAGLPLVPASSVTPVQPYFPAQAASYTSASYAPTQAVYTPAQATYTTAPQATYTTAPQSYIAPQSYAAPQSLPVGYTTITPTAAPLTTFPASGLQLHALNDPQRKKLEKQAMGHNKKAEKESRRATKDLAKAEKLHNKGKDSRAFKHETRAEQHSVAAKHHQLWAQDLAKDAAPATSFVQQPAYRPAM